MFQIEILYVNYAPFFIQEQEEIVLKFNNKKGYRSDHLLMAYTDPNYENVNIELVEFEESPSFHIEDRKTPFFI
tara:strand:+ start:186 stop:407 length:222 start_codon:yes stop_codon:yes gene_type:complete